MGRQENIEIFEDTQRMYKTNVRLIEAIKRSAKEQQLFKCDCQIAEERQRSAVSPVKICVSAKLNFGSSISVCIYRKESLCLEFCFGNQSRWWCDTRIFRTGRSNLPLFYIISKLE